MFLGHGATYCHIEQSSLPDGSYIEVLHVTVTTKREINAFPPKNPFNVPQDSLSGNKGLPSYCTFPYFTLSVFISTFPRASFLLPKIVFPSVLL